MTKADPAIWMAKYNSSYILNLHGYRRSESRLLLAVESCSGFVQQLVLLLPTGLEHPRKDLLKIISVVHSSMKKNNVGTLFRPG